MGVRRCTPLANEKSLASRALFDCADLIVEQPEGDEDWVSYCSLRARWLSTMGWIFCSSGCKALLMASVSIGPSCRTRVS